MRTEFARLIWIQGVILVIAAYITYTVADLSAVKSIVYGNLVVLISALFLAWRYGQKQQADAVGVLKLAYKTAIERFVGAIFLLVIGFKLLELAPLWLLMGFVIGQVVWLFAPIWMKFEKTK
jgi:F0F1-type ATP synthase assembly protein I